MTKPPNPDHVDEQRLRLLIDQLANQLCQAVDGRFDFAVRVEGQDEAIEKLQMLIDLVLDAAHRSDSQLRAMINELSDQMCQAVDGRFDFAVRIEGQDETIEKLQMLINFVLDAARRSLTEIETKAHALEAKTQTLSTVNLELGREITERVTAEVELLRSERQLREKTEELETQKECLEAEISQRTAAQDQLRHDAMLDSLTGLSNRAVLLDRIERCLQRTKSEPGYVFALLFLDFDRFKIINDSLGHGVGDQLLISIADRLQGNLRVGDTASRVDQEPDPENDNLSVRLGGDEFVILLDGIKNVADATLVAERIQKSLEAPHKIGSYAVTSTARIGIVTSDLGYDSADDMLRDADTAMYRAKGAGRARHQLFDRAMHDEAVVRLELESDLRHALQDEQFRLVYQPIIDLQTGLAVGLEALIRCDHPERGVISPLDFIPVVEEIGLIVPIGGWVLLEARQQLKQWQEQFPCESPLCMNVNISKRQLTQSDLVKTIRDVLTTTRIEPRTLKLEITETAIMDNLDELNPVLQRLRACGVFLCIDDFGTGHSSLSRLHEFSIDVLKVDRAFLDNMKENRAYAAVTHAIVTLAQNLGMDVVAEGVETPQQVAQLQTLEADYAQGYYFARPLRPDDAAAFLQNQRPLAKSA
ncbi:MAG: EAL domain-containing protein [Phycisphaerales bacterium]